MNFLIIGQNNFFEQNLLNLYENIDKLQNSFNFIILPACLSLMNVKTSKIEKPITTCVSQMKLYQK